MADVRKLNSFGKRKEEKARRRRRGKGREGGGQGRCHEEELEGGELRTMTQGGVRVEKAGEEDKGGVGPEEEDTIQNGYKKIGYQNGIYLLRPLSKV